MQRAALLLPVALAAGCALPGGALYLDLPAPPTSAPPLAEKAARLEADLDAFHLPPWGAFSYRVHLPGGPEGERVHAYESDQPAWTGALLAAECERWAATKDPAAVERARTLLRALTTLTAVTGQRGHYARTAAPAGSFRREVQPERWRDGARGFEGWRWIGDPSRDQAAGIVHGLAAVLDLLEDPFCRSRAARLAGDLADRVFGRGLSWEDETGEETTYGDLRPYIWGLPIGVNGAILLGLADAADRGTGEERHRRRLERLVEEEGALDTLRWPTIRILGKENWSTANMAAMALASFLRRPAPEGDPLRARIREAAADSMRRILDLHRGEGNAFWIAVAAGAGEAAGATARDLEDARTQLRRYPLDRRVAPLDHGALDLPRASLGSKKGREQFVRPLPVDMLGPNSFCWKSNPFEVVQETEGGGGGETRVSGADFLAAYWPLRRLGILGPGD
ncbi:MAG: hypothetical protein L6R43_11920 [Planctomycetes bacterium]|nr:hypothetical protein [Planctomycetota bacterium]